MFEIGKQHFYLDGKKIHIYSGAMHYFRIPCDYWEDRLLKLKAAGFNTVETYIAWNVHEPKEGEFCFEGQGDVVQFLKTAQKVGLYAIVRPGPYICAEWDFGGFPSWLLKYENIRLRCLSQPYMTFVERYFQVLLPRLAALQNTRGGPILMMQIENEYGSYGSDHLYLARLRDLMRQNGIEVPLFTSDGESRYHLSGGSLPDTFKVVNFGGFPNDGFRELQEYQPEKPLMCGELWCGWFDHFREKHHHSAAPWVKQTFRTILQQFFALDASFNFYMFHGGTNFGCTAGANFSTQYQPTTTSYDYDAPLNEYGGYTTKYFVIRDLLCEKQGISPALPPAPKTQRIGEVRLTEAAQLFPHIPAAAAHFKEHLPHSMEHYGLDHGIILYHTEIEGDYPDTSISAFDVHDIAYVYVNGAFVGKYDRSVPLTKTEIKHGVTANESFTFPIPAFRGKITVDIYVESMGRINFAKHLYDRKGLSAVCIGEQYVYDFDIYTIPLDRFPAFSFTQAKPDMPCPVYLKGRFCTDSRADCFVDISNFTKGYVFVNGINLGRYWEVGPQQTLYLPGVWLKEENEIVVLELEAYGDLCLTITNKPRFGNPASKKEKRPKGE